VHEAAVAHADEAAGVADEVADEPPAADKNDAAVADDEPVAKDETASDADEPTTGLAGRLSRLRDRRRRR
jgi:hypothetical protein